MRRSSIDKAMTSLLKWSNSEEWEPLYRETLTAHLEPVITGLGLTGEELGDILGDAIHTFEAFIAEDFFAARFGEDGERNIIDDYLKRRGWREPVPTRRYLEALRDSTASLYEVVGIDRGRSITLRDLLLGGGTVTVREKRGSMSMPPWERLAARMVEVNGRSYLTGVMLRFDHELSREFLSGFDEICSKLEQDIRSECRETGEEPPSSSEVREAVARQAPCALMLSEFWLCDTILGSRAPMPEVQNADGDPIMFCETRFPVAGDSAGVAAALDAIEEFERDKAGAPRWTWLTPEGERRRFVPPPNDGMTLEFEDDFTTSTLGHAELAAGALVLTVNSRERAERGKALLAGRLGGLVGQPLISLQDPAKALEEHLDEGPQEAEMPPGKETAAIHAYLDEHYRRVLDEPLPALDGKTLRQAASSEKDRGRAIDWLKQLENMEHHRAAAQGVRSYDASWIWRELGIVAPR